LAQSSWTSSCADKVWSNVFYDSEDPTCTVRTYSAGEAFIDSGQGHVHIARNEGSVNLELWATYFDVPAGGAFRINADSTGNCGF